MATKRKAEIAVSEPGPEVRKDKPRVVQTPEYPRSRHEVDQKWEEIRVRGEQISADIKALLARVSSNSV